MSRQNGSVKREGRLEKNRKGTCLFRVCPCWILNRVDTVAAVLWMELHSLEEMGSWAKAAPGVRFLAETVGVSRDKIIESIRSLESIGALRVHRRDKRTSLYETIYDAPERHRTKQPDLELPDGPDELYDSVDHQTDVQPPEPASLDDWVDTKQKKGATSLRSVASPSGSPVSEARANGGSGLSTRELVGAFLEAWRSAGLGEYTVTGKDRAVLKDHVADFRTFQEAVGCLTQRIKWATQKEFWQEHLCLRSVLETVANQHRLISARLARGTGSPSGSGASHGALPQRMSEEYRQILAEQLAQGKATADPATLKAFGLESTSSSESTDGSVPAIQAGT